MAYLDLFKEKFPFLPENSYLKKSILIKTLKQLKSELRIID